MPPGLDCTLQGDADHRAMIQLYMQEWNRIRHHICTVLNNSFPEKEFRHRFRVTNNGENRTFWPSWIGLYDDEDMDFALTVLRIFRKAYEQYFNGTLQECGQLAPIAFRHVQAAFTESTFADLVRAVGNAYGRGNAEAAAEMFSRFIVNASGRGIFMPDPSYDYALHYMGDASLGLTGSNIEFSTLMHILTMEMGNRLGLKVQDGKIKTPWGLICKAFLDSEGVVFKTGMRTQWQTALTDIWSACARTVALCLDESGRMP